MIDSPSYAVYGPETLFGLDPYRFRAPQKKSRNTSAVPILRTKHYGPHLASVQQQQQQQQQQQEQQQEQQQVSLGLEVASGPFCAGLLPNPKPLKGQKTLGGMKVPAQSRAPPLSPPLAPAPARGSTSARLTRQTLVA